MKNLTMVFLATAALASFGCKKKDGDAAGKAGGEAAKPAEAKPASDSAGGTGCAANATRSVEGGFCLDLPPTMKGSDPYDKDDRSRRYDYGDGNGKGLTVVVTKLAEAKEWDDEVSMLADETKQPDHKQQQSIDLPGGGKFMSYVGDDGMTWATALAHKDTKLLFCRTNGKPADPALVDACKSIRPL
jgi:hypothetical protein